MRIISNNHKIVTICQMFIFILLTFSLPLLLLLLLLLIKLPNVPNGEPPSLQCWISKNRIVHLNFLCYFPIPPPPPLKEMINLVLIVFLPEILLISVRYKVKLTPGTARRGKGEPRTNIIGPRHAKRARTTYFVHF